MNFHKFASFGLFSVLGLCGCAQLNYEPIAFSCSPGQPACPEGYQCELRECVRINTRVPILVTSNLGQYVVPYEIRRTPNSLLACWQQALETRLGAFECAGVNRDGRIPESPSVIFSQGADSMSALRDVVFRSSAVTLGNDLYYLNLVSTRTSTFQLASYRVLDLRAGTRQRTNPDEELRLNNAQTLWEFSAATVGGSYWVFYSENLTGGASPDVNQIMVRLTYTPGAPVVRERFELTPTLDLTRRPTGLEVLSAREGAWLVQHYTDQLNEFRWIRPRSTFSPALQRTTLPTALRTTPIAVNDQQLAIGLKLNTNTNGSAVWQIFWVSPNADDSTSPSATPGPTFTTNDQLQRIEGLTEQRDGRTLLTLAIPSNSNGTSMEIRSVAWGETTLLSNSSTFTKRSRSNPTRTTLVLNGTNRQLFWIERLPASEGFGETDSLFTIQL